MALEKERETYAQYLDLLQKTAPGKFVLVHQHQLAGLFDTREDAEHLGGLKFGDAPYLVEQVPALEPPSVPDADLSEDESDDDEETVAPDVPDANESTVEAVETPEPDLPVSPVSPDYERVRRRLDGFETVKEEDRAEAWEWLMAWRRHLLEGFGSELPAPWVFAGESGVVELSWELTYCSLTLRMIPGGPFEFTKIEASPEVDLEETGTVEIRDVPEMLLWMVGK